MSGGFLIKSGVFLHPDSPVSEKVSVILPACNKARFLESVFLSIKKSVRDVYELIVLDDASTDNTPEICRRLKSQDYPFQIKVLRNETNLGAAATRN